MNTSILILLSVFLGVSLLLMLIKYIFRSVQSKLEEKIKQNHNVKDIIISTTSANFFGLSSLGSGQIRGNGALVLTDRSLTYYLAIPQRKYEISIDSIKNVTLPKTFNGKSVFSQLLCITFEAPDNDAIAWRVNNPEEWKNKIELIMASASNKQ